MNSRFIIWYLRKKSRNYEKRYRQNNADEYKDDNDIFIYRRGKTLICLPLL